MGIQMIMRPQLWLLNSGYMLCKHPRFELMFFYLLCHLDSFAVESESEEEVTDNSPKGSSDEVSDWSDTSETSRCWHFCSSSMNQG